MTKCSAFEAVKDFRGHDASNCVFFSFWRCAKRLYCDAVSSRTTE